MREVPPEAIAAAWRVVRDRWPHGKFLGVGPAFKEAIEAALQVINATPPTTQQENE